MADNQEWVICPECHSELREPVGGGRFARYRCGACHRRFRAYEGKALVFFRRRHVEDITYYVLLSGRILPRPFIIRDETLSEMIVNLGDRVVVGFRGDRIAIVQNLSKSTYWVIHNNRTPGCLELMACAFFVAGIAGALVIGAAK